MLIFVTVSGEVFRADYGKSIKLFDLNDDEKKGYSKMSGCVFTIKDIVRLVKPVAEKYGVKEVYLFGSYARGEADENSDLDFLVFGGENFKLTMIFAFAEDLRSILKKNVDVFEISEINKGSEFYNTIMKERLFVA